MKQYELYNNTKIIYETPDDGYSYFFGYYDKPSLNKENTKLLTHRVAFDGRDVKDGDIAEVGYVDLKENRFIKIDETLAWNWQQGSQLQWLPPEYDNKIIYNSIKENKFISIIYNLETKEKKIIPFPIYVVHPNGKEALGVNYERHYWCRYGYNYQNIKNKKWDKPYHQEDGIFRIDLETGEYKLIISTADIIKIDYLQNFEECNNWLEHIMYNPNGDRFMFFHRWAKDGVDISRVYIANSNDGKSILKLPENKFYSHYFWKDNNELSIWTNNNISKESISANINRIKNISLLKIFLKPLYKIVKLFLPQAIKQVVAPSSQLYLFKDNDKLENCIVSNNILSDCCINGHQSWYKSKEKLLTDSYQDKEKYRWLYSFDIEKSSLVKLAKFYSEYNDSGFRCDLHPSLSIDEQYIVIDVAYNTKRKKIILRVENDK